MVAVTADQRDLTIEFNEFLRLLAAHTAAGVQQAELREALRWGRALRHSI